jgi:hypothetical protein
LNRLHKPSTNLPLLRRSHAFQLIEGDVQTAIR